METLRFWDNSGGNYFFEMFDEIWRKCGKHKQENWYLKVTENFVYFQILKQIIIYIRKDLVYE